MGNYCTDPIQYKCLQFKVDVEIIDDQFLDLIIDHILNCKEYKSIYEPIYGRWKSIYNGPRPIQYRWIPIKSHDQSYILIYFYYQLSSNITVKSIQCCVNKRFHHLVHPTFMEIHLECPANIPITQLCLGCHKKKCDTFQYGLHTDAVHISLTHHHCTDCKYLNNTISDNAIVHNINTCTDLECICTSTDNHCIYTEPICDAHKYSYQFQLFMHQSVMKHINPSLKIRREQLIIVMQEILRLHCKNTITNTSPQTHTYTSQTHSKHIVNKHIMDVMDMVFTCTDSRKYIPFSSYVKKCTCRLILSQILLIVTITTADLQKDIKEECSKYGTVKNINITSSLGETKKIHKKNEILGVSVEFETKKQAKTALHHYRHCNQLRHYKGLIKSHCNQLIREHKDRILSVKNNERTSDYDQMHHFNFENDKIVMNRIANMIDHGYVSPDQWIENVHELKTSFFDPSDILYRLIVNKFAWTKKLNQKKLNQKELIEQKLNQLQNKLNQKKLNELQKKINDMKSIEKKFNQLQKKLNQMTLIEKNENDQLQKKLNQIKFIEKELNQSQTMKLIEKKLNDQLQKKLNQKNSIDKKLNDRLQKKLLIEKELNLLQQKLNQKKLIKKELNQILQKKLDHQKITIPIQALDEDGNVAATFAIDVSYSQSTKIRDLVSKITKYLNITHFPKTYMVCYVHNESFVDISDPIHCNESKAWTRLCSGSITNYNTTDILEKGLIVCVKNKKFFKNLNLYNGRWNRAIKAVQNRDCGARYSRKNSERFAKKSEKELTKLLDMNGYYNRYRIERQLQKNKHYNNNDGTPDVLFELDKPLVLKINGETKIIYWIDFKNWCCWITTNMRYKLWQQNDKYSKMYSKKSEKLICGFMRQCMNINNDVSQGIIHEIECISHMYYAHITPGMFVFRLGYIENITIGNDMTIVSLLWLQNNIPNIKNTLTKTRRLKNLIVDKKDMKVEDYY